VDKRVYLVGTKDLETNFKNRGINLISGNEKTADIVVTSFDTTLTYEKLNNACRFVRNGAEYFSTHPDYNCPTEDGFIPDSGAISAFVTASTGKVPTYFGKPYKETIDMISKVTGFSTDEMCVFGDRLYTDIALGKKNGVTSILVLTGETTLSDVENAEAESKPDFVFPSLLEVDEVTK
jgi:HAD superfamily hydrolase (TIGR01450 family)